MIGQILSQPGWEREGGQGQPLPDVLTFPEPAEVCTGEVPGVPVSRWPNRAPAHTVRCSPWSPPTETLSRTQAQLPCWHPRLAAEGFLSPEGSRPGTGEPRRARPPPWLSGMCGYTPCLPDPQVGCPGTCFVLCPQALQCDWAPVTHSGHLLHNTPFTGCPLFSASISFSLQLFPRITSRMDELPLKLF